LVRCEEYTEKDSAVDHGMETNLQGREPGRDDELVVFFGEADSQAIADQKHLKLTRKNSSQAEGMQDAETKKWGPVDAEMIY
jgi:hypothetical protein